MIFNKGEIIDGLYEIQETFGGGGMGMVHRVINKGLVINPRDRIQNTIETRQIMIH